VFSEAGRRTATFVYPGARLAVLLAWVLVPVAAMAADPEAPRLFRDVAREAGVAFTHHSAPDKKYIVESMSGGVALFDFDNDGRVDIYLVDSLTTDTARNANAARSALYRNLGQGRFEDVTDKAGVAHPGWGMGACVADFDGDGWKDLYVTAIGANRLYHNEHDGTFKDVAAQAGAAVGGWSSGCGFADYDHDGDLDLFVSRYVEIDLEHLPEFGRGKTCEYRGIAVQCGPRGLPGLSDVLLRNDGKGTFTDVSAAAGVADPKGYFGLGVAWLDYNDDGWLDLFVANDSTPNFLYVNQKDGTFKESAFPLGVAVSEDGSEQGCMGVAAGDYDRSGRFSLFVTNFSDEYNSLYHNEGTHFVDVSFRSRTAPTSLPFVGWGTAFFDYDNDGWQDILAVNGHVYPQLVQSKLGASAPYEQRKLLYHNRGDGTFDEVAARYGPLLLEPRVSRGIGVADLDDDGRLDVVVNDLDGPAQILHNELPDVGHWLIVRLHGRAPNTDAVGTVVTTRTGSAIERRLVRSGTGYLSQDDMRLHFGLGAATTVDVLEVTWPDGTKTTKGHVKADQVLQLTQD
jgi:hypothetical protein